MFDRLAVCTLAAALTACASTDETPPPPAGESSANETPAEESSTGATSAEETSAEETSAEGSTPDEEPGEEPDVAKLEVAVLELDIEIAAPVEKVWEIMFSPEGYTKWTAPFMAGSYFEGTWAEGERMYFLAPGGSGMVAEIAENRLHEVVSVKHLGFVSNGVEDTTSDGVRSWAPAYENYYLETVPGGTVVRIEHEVLVAMENYMRDVWPRALDALKSLCENE